MNKEIDGYHIVGSYQSVAWVKTLEEAKALCMQMNHGMVSGSYRIEPSLKTKHDYPA